MILSFLSVKSLQPLHLLYALLLLANLLQTKSQIDIGCLEDLYCYICPFTSYDPTFANTLKLSLNQDKVLDSSQCILKNNTLKLKKNILILNSAICDECKTQSFDETYQNLIQAFQEETKNSLKFLYSNLNFFLQSGDHFINKGDLLFTETEFFRRILADITIQSVSSKSSVNVYLKTNKFFIFISKTFKIENISFYGNDLPLNEDNPCLSLKNQTCCTEELLNQTYYPNSTNLCGIKGLTKQDDSTIDYGLFNLEYIFDNTISNDYPNLIIKNCLMKNFYFFNNKPGFVSAIMMTSYSGKVEIYNLTMKNVYFSLSFIYYLNSNYDLFVIIEKNLITNQNFLNNIKNLNETIIIENSHIFNVNPFLNEISKSLDNYITLLNWKGSLIIENSTIDSVFSIKAILIFSNEGTSNGKFSIKNSVFKNIYNTSLFQMENILNLEINSLYFFDSTNTINEFIQIKNIEKISIDEINILNITIGYQLSCIKMSESNTEIKNSFFKNSVVKSMFYQSDNNMAVINCTFTNISFQDAIIIFSSGNTITIKQSYFKNLTGTMSIFYVTSSQKIIIESVLIKKISSYSVFFLNNVNQNLIYELFATQNLMTILWSSDQTCLITTLAQSFITNNIFGNLYVDFNIPNILVTFENLYLHYNNFTSTALIRLYFGVGLFNRLNFIDNFFTNSRIFLMVLNFSKGCKIFLNNSYFENNGVTSKKTYYVGFTDNCFVSMGLGVKLTIYDNLTLIASEKIEMVSGFFSGDTHGGLFQLTNSRLILLSSNKNFGYKGIYMGDFVIAQVYNNSFYNLLCNTLTKLHMHGTVFLGSSSSYIYSKNTRSLYFYNNSFYNCSCIFGGGLAIIGLKKVGIENCSFYNSSASKFGGHLILIASENSVLKNIILNNSVSDEGSGLYFLNILNLTVHNVSLENAFSKKNGVIFCRLISYLIMTAVKSKNTTTRQNGGFLYLMNGVAKLENITISITYASLSGGSIFTHGSSSLFMKNVMIENSYASTGGSLNIESSETIEISDCSLILSISTNKGAAIFVNSVKLFVLRNIAIERNANIGGNGVILIQTDDENAKIILKNLICLNSFAIKGSCIYYFSSTPLEIDNIFIENCRNSSIFTSWSFQIPIKIYNLLIKNINSEENLINVNAAHVNFSNWEVYNNNVSSPLLGFYQVSGEISQIQIKNNSLIKAFDFIESDVHLSNFLILNDDDFNQKIGFFNLISTNLNLTNGLIKNTYGLDISFLSEGNAFLENITFSNSMGQILFLIFSNLQLRNCYFLNNTGFEDTTSNDIYFSNTKNILFQIEIDNSTFEIFSHYSLNLEGLIQIQINNSNFVYKNSKNSKVFSMYAFNFYSLSIDFSNFSYFTDSSLQIKTDNFNFASKSKINITNSAFCKNRATIGSSVYISGNLDILFHYCKFYENYAYVTNQNYNFLTGVAPCIFFKPLNSSRSKITIWGCSFINNTAEYIAPTVFSQMALSVDRFNFYSNNTYLYYVNFTHKIFSFPISLKPLSYERQNESFLVSSSNETIDLVSGQPFNLTLQLTDYFGQILTFDNSTILMIKIYDIKLGISLENNLAITKNGNVEFRNLLIRANSNTNFSLSFEGYLSKIAQDLRAELNPEYIQNEFYFKTRNCLFGEIILNDSTCFKCKENSYSLIDPMKTEIKYQRCSPCPTNSHCLGGSFITPQSGYYRKSFISNNVVACIQAESCLGFVETSNFSDPSLINGVCAPGSFGPLCFYCNPIYGKAQSGDPCSYCNNISALVYTRLILTLIFILLNIIISVSTIERYSKKNNEKDLFSIVSKIIINHSQHLMLIIKKSLSLPDFSAFKDFFNSFDYLSFINMGSFMNECFTNSFYYNPKKLIVDLSLYAALIPFMFAILAFGFWLFLAFFFSFVFKSNNFKKQLNNLHRQFFLKYFIYLLLTAYMFYPLILKSSFTLMDCFKLDIHETTTYLRESPEIECWGSEHFSYIALYGFPGLFIWGISFPIFLFIILRKNYAYISKNKKKESTNKSIKSFEHSPYSHKKSNINPKSQEKSNDSFANFKPSLVSNETVHRSAESIPNKNHMILSFFYCGYRSKYYYWECVIFFRKFFLTFILTLDQKIEEGYKWTLVLTILFLAFSASFHSKPYKIVFLNKLELFSLLTCIVSSFISALSVTNANEAFKSVINIICIGFNLMFYISAVLLIAYDFYNKIKGRTLKLKEYVISNLKKKTNGKMITKKTKNIELSFNVNTHLGNEVAKIKKDGPL